MVVTVNKHAWRVMSICKKFTYYDKYSYCRMSRKKLVMRLFDYFDYEIKNGEISKAYILGVLVATGKIEFDMAYRWRMKMKK